jgi:hypothetical protein
MRTPFEKLKKADKELLAVMIFCLFMAILFLGAVLGLYLKHDLSNIRDRELPVNTYKLYIKAYLVAVCGLMPCAGVGFLLVGYKIWDYRRKRGEIKQDDITNKTTPMNSDTTQRSRPIAVDFAVALFLISVGWALIDAAFNVYRHLDPTDIYVLIEVRSIIYLIVFWCIYKGMNWARWLWIVNLVAGICFLFYWISHHTVSTWWIEKFCLHTLMEVIAIIALFQPSSNKWFRKN